MTFTRAAVIGTGMMGPGIALSLTRGGVAAAILSRTPEGAEKGLASAQQQLALLEQHGLVTADTAAWSRANLSASADFEANIAAADLVIESAPEDLAFKQDLFAHMDSIAKPDAILASNTSALSITSIAEKCMRPERILTTHFWNPPHLMRLVEIVRGAKTAPQAAQAIKELLTRCGKLAVVIKKDRPGQLGNRLQFALIREAVNIIQEGIADAGDVDTVAKAGFGVRLPVYGILEHQDIVGLETGLAIMEYVAPDLNSNPKGPQLMRELFESGATGAKAGRGFYDWSRKDPGAVRALRDEFVLEFMKSKFGRIAKPASSSQD